MIFPLYKNFMPDVYWKSFVLCSIATTSTAVIAIMYSDLINLRIKQNNCDKNNKKIFCIFHNNTGLRYLQLFIVTFFISFIILYLMYIILGFGGGSIHKFYKYNHSENKYIFIVTFIIIIFIMFIYLFISFRSSKYNIRKLPSVTELIRIISISFGFSTNETKSDESKIN
jgi:hypothetical protein